MGRSQGRRNLFIKLNGWGRSVNPRLAFGVKNLEVGVGFVGEGVGVVSGVAGCGSR
jgi:hypothetical protein